MTPAALVLAPAVTVLLVVAAGFAWEGKGAAALVQGLADKQQIEGRSASVLFGLTIFGIAIGVPLAVGLVDTSMLSLLAAPLCCMAGSWLLTHDLSHGPSAVAWFSVMAWCASIPYLIAGSMSATAPSAMQAILGPLPFNQSLARSVSLLVAMVAGCIAGAKWVSSLPVVGSGMAATLVRWGQTALAGAMVFGMSAGPGLGAVAYGPADLIALGWTAISLGSTISGVMLVAFLGKRTWRMPERYLFVSLAALSALAMVGAAVG